MRFPIAVLSVLLAVQAVAQEGGSSCLFDTACPESSAPAAAADEAFLKEGRVQLARMDELSRAAKAAPPTPWTGAKKGAEEGGLLGFFAVISPAAALMSEGFSRKMSRAYDGARDGNDWGDAYIIAGIAVGAVLYVPALALGLVGGIIGTPAGAVAETVSPGSTAKWNAEGWLFD